MPLVGAAKLGKEMAEVSMELYGEVGFVRLPCIGRHRVSSGNPSILIGVTL